MGLFRLAACLLLLTSWAAGESKQAGRIYKEARRAERDGQIVRAYLLYAEAAALDPSNTDYWLRSKTLRARAVEMAKSDKRWPLLSTEGPREAPQAEAGASGRITQFELTAASRAQPPVELKVPEVRKDLDFRGNARALFEQTAKAYGLEAFFEPEYQPGSSFRFQLTDASYREALRALEAATGSFVVPLEQKLFLVVKDTPQKRAEFAPAVSVAVPIPEPVSLQEAQELVRAVQQVMNLLRFTLDSQRRIVLMRDQVSKVRPALLLFQQLLRHRAQVAIELEFLEFDAAGSKHYGTQLQTLFPLVSFGKVLHSTPSPYPGFMRYAGFGGGAALLGLGVADARMFASMERSALHTLLKTEIRSVEGQPATVHVGEKFPILTGALLTSGSSQGQQFPFPPAFNFEDLGLTLKVTPHVQEMGDVTMELETEFKVLTGDSANGIPVIANRQLKSTVRLRENEWAVVAGLMDGTETRTITGPAGLASLPFVGPLLRENTRSKDASSVLLLLKPVLLNPAPAQQDETTAVWLGSEARPASPL